MLKSRDATSIAGWIGENDCIGFEIESLRTVSWQTLGFRLLVELRDLELISLEFDVQVVEF